MRIFPKQGRRDATGMGMTIGLQGSRRGTIRRRLLSETCVRTIWMPLSGLTLRDLNTAAIIQKQDRLLCSHVMVTQLMLLNNSNPYRPLYEL